MTVAVPDFGALANQQQAANDDATRRTTWSNRPDQTTALGNISWNQTPDGRWINNTTLSGQAQGLFDTTMSGQQNLGSQIGAGAPQASFGAQQNVIDAWNALQQPGLDKAGEAARARAAAMGITLGSNANNDIERNIGVNEATSRNQGILQGVNAYNQFYQNQLAGYNANIQGSQALGNIRESLNPNKWASNVPTGAAYIPNTVYGAALDTFSANRQNENADIAASQAKTDSYINALRAAGGTQGITGIVNGIGSLASGAGKVWDWAKDIYTNW